MKILQCAFILTFNPASLAFTGPNLVSKSSIFRVKPLNGWISDMYNDRSDDVEELRQLTDRIKNNPLVGNALKAGASFSEEEDKITWEVKDDGLFGFVPTKEMTGVDPHMTKLCATISKQLYDLDDIKDFQLSTKDHKAEMIIFDNHGNYREATPPFGVAVIDDTMILGWRGTQSMSDMLNDVALAPQSSFAWRKHANTIKVQGAMTSIVTNDLVLHEDEIIKYVLDNNIKNIITTGQSLGGGCAQIGHLIIRAQMEDRSSPWNDLKRINVRSVGICAPMTIAVIHNAKGEHPSTDNLLKKMSENSCNLIYSNDVVPRAYGYVTFLEDFMDNAVEGISKNRIPGPRLFKMMFDVRGKLENLVGDTVESDFVAPFIGVMSSYRQLGNQIYYESEDVKPRVLTDMGFSYKNTMGRKDILRDVKYKKVKRPLDKAMSWHMDLIGNGIVYGSKAETERCGLCYPPSELS